MTDNGRELVRIRATANTPANRMTGCIDIFWVPFQAAEDAGGRRANPR
jgi:hypothetical protein